MMVFLSENGDVPPLKAETFDVTLSCPVHPGISAYLIGMIKPARVPYELSGHKIYLVSGSP